MWHKFRILKTGSGILRGTYSMNDKRFTFQSRGQQGTACSIVAFVFGYLFEPKDWTKPYVDQVLNHGDKIFKISQLRNRVKPGMYMVTNLIIPEFYVGDYKCKIDIEKSNVYGNLFDESSRCLTFSVGLKKFFKSFEYGVVTAQGMSVAMWKVTKMGFMYFDAGSCGEDGIRCSEGAACVLRFKSLNDMRDLFLSNMNKKYNSMYCIDKIKILELQLISRDKFTYKTQLLQDKKVLQADSVHEQQITLDCTSPVPKFKQKARIMVSEIKRIPLNIIISNYIIDSKLASDILIDQNISDTGYKNYDIHKNIPSSFKEMSSNITILHGWTHELSDVYKGKGAQNVANCVIAIMMRKIHPVESWLRPKLDEILALGDAVYAQIKSEKPTIKYMTVDDLNNLKFQIEDKILIAQVDLLTVMGTLISKIPSVLNLKQALEEFFLVNNDGVIETSSMAVAIWSESNSYYMFDPRQCDISGVRINEEKGKSGTSTKDAQYSEEKKISGKCCVVRFPDIGSLVALFFKNIDPEKKNDRFIIRHIIPIDDVLGTRSWNEFQPGEMGKTWVLRGTIANDSDLFEEESSGSQGIAIPIVALISAKEIPPSKWTKNDVDDNVKEGDAYYNWCISLEQEENRKLFLTNLKKDLYVKKRKVRINVEESVVIGDTKKILNLEKGIQIFFENHQFGFIEVGDISLAIWKFEEELKDKTKEISYYLFDPNPRSRLGLAKLQEEEEEDPVACVIRTLNSKELASLIERNLNDEAESEFYIHVLNVVSIGEVMTDEEIEKDKTIPVKPDLNHYVAIGDESAGLYGNFNQGDEKLFRQQTRNKQQAANALVALAMTKLYHSHLWYPEVVDDIIKIGDKLTIDNLANLPEAEEDEESPRLYLLPGEINPEFSIGVNRITLSLEEESETGKITDLTKTLEIFFENNSMGIFEQEDVAIPIWKEGSAFFMMDPRGRDNRNQPNEKEGIATVFWSINISTLAANLQSSAQKSDGEFTICVVDIENVYETRVPVNERVKKFGSGEDLWYYFLKKLDGIWTIQGNVSMSDEKFEEENRNKQSVAIAAMAIVFFKVYQPHQWTSQILDEVVITGNKFYSQCVARFGKDTTLRINNIITEFFLSNRRIDLTITDCVEAGSLSKKFSKIQDLQTGIDAFFKNHDNGVLVINDIHNIAIFKVNSFYYCVIPNYEMMRFSSMTLLVEELLSRYGMEGDYEVSVIEVIVSNTDPPWKYDPSFAIRPSDLPPLNAFQKLKKPARAILRGSVHQGSDIFPDGIRGRQTASNCIVALGMSVIKNPATWTRKILDEILVTGNRVHRETMKLNLGKEKFKPTDVVRVFELGVNVLMTSVEDATISGLVALRPVEPEAKTTKKKGPVKKVQPGRQKKGQKGKTTREVTPPPPPILLEEGIQTFLKENNAGILYTGKYMCAIWKDLGVYFMYDPRARNEDGVQNDEGFSCVMWFACLEPFIDLIKINIDESEKYNPYEICRIIVKRIAIEPLPCPSGFQPYSECISSPVPMSVMKKIPTLNVKTRTNFCLIDDELSVLRGTMNMYHYTFDIQSRGYQSTAISAVAIVVALLHVPLIWTPGLIDAILKYGDILHIDSTRAARSGPRNLSPCELLTVFIVADFRVRIHIHRHTMAGILHDDDLEQSLRLFFRNNCSGILHTTNLAVAVMQHYGKFYLFNPNSGHDGVACVFKCESVLKMATMFIANCSFKRPTVYTLNAVNVLNLRFFSRAESKCPKVCEQ